MNDKTTTVSELREIINKFCEVRGWKRNVNAKDISIALSVETAELIEIFTWLKEEDVVNLPSNDAKLTHLKEEIADVFWYLVRICEYYDIDLTESVMDKKTKNAVRYPEPN